MKRLRRILATITRQPLAVFVAVLVGGCCSGTIVGTSDGSDGSDTLVCRDGQVDVCFDPRADLDGDGYTQLVDCDDNDPMVNTAETLPCTDDCGNATGAQTCSFGIWGQCTWPDTICLRGAMGLCGTCGTGTQSCNATTCTWDACVGGAQVCMNVGTGSCQWDLVSEGPSCGCPDPGGFGGPGCCPCSASNSAPCSTGDCIYRWNEITRRVCSCP